MKPGICIALAALLLSGSALAQGPGMGETRPADPAARERSGPADDAVKGTVIKEREPVVEPDKAQSDSDRALMRCNQLTGALRDDCLRQERAAAGGTRAAEPATAPPPQNPR
jgi:hypothetical protein